MSKTMTLEDIKNLQTGAGEEDTGPKGATFLADTLTLTITDPSGNVVLQAPMSPRGFKAKEDKRNGKVKGGCGWYAAPKASDGGSYQGIPVNGGFRLSLDGVKLSPDQTVDLRSGR